MATADWHSCVIHAERRAHEGLLDVVHGHCIAAEQCADEAVLNEPRDDIAAATVQDGGTDYPHDMTATCALGEQQLRHGEIVDRLLARDVRAHELEFTARSLAAEEAVRIHVNALTAVLGVADRDALSGLDITSLGDVQRAIFIEHDSAV